MFSSGAGCAGLVLGLDELDGGGGGAVAAVVVEEEEEAEAEGAGDEVEGESFST